MRGRELVLRDPILHAVHSLRVRQAVGGAVDLVDELGWVDEFESFDMATKRLK